MSYDELAGSFPKGHTVQFHTADAEALLSNVRRYICEGLANGESVIAFADSENIRRFSAALAQSGCDVATNQLGRRLLFLDAQQTLARFMTDGRPSWKRFEETIEAAIRLLAPGHGIRGYGEMVGILWRTWQFSAAVELEGFWNRFLQSRNIPLFCSYPIDVFDREFQKSCVEALLCDHTHVLPSGVPHALEAAMNRALDERLGSAAADVRKRASAPSQPSWASMPCAEATILWLRSNAPEQAESIIRLAQRYYRAATAQMKSHNNNGAAV